MNRSTLRNLALGAILLAGASFHSTGAEARGNWGFSYGHGGAGFYYNDGHRHRGHRHGGHYGYRHSYTPRRHYGYSYGRSSYHRSSPRYYGHRGYYGHCY